MTKKNSLLDLNPDYARNFPSQLREMYSAYKAHGELPDKSVVPGLEIHIEKGRYTGFKVFVFNFRFEDVEGSEDKLFVLDQNILAIPKGKEKIKNDFDVLLGQIALQIFEDTLEYAKDVVKEIPTNDTDTD